MIIIKLLRKIYIRFFFNIPIKKIPECIENPHQASKLIYDTLISDEPSMIARFGSTELATLINYLEVKKQDKNIWKYIKTGLPWWWEQNIIDQMQQWSGFFPPTKDKIEQFCELMLQDIKEVDILGSWIANEYYFEDRLMAKKVHLRLLDPFGFETQTPWTAALKDKKILIVHPFVELMISQYQNRTLLFNNKDVLPTFASIAGIKAIQSLGAADPRFSDWFEALSFMKAKINEQDYDICLIGAGAYGFPLAAHVKRMGKKAVHMGGSLQLLFGIRGKRWDDPNYGVKEWGIPKGSYSNLVNEHWVRPGDNLKPKNSQQVEGSCYW
ncbi:hypothetical protein [Confluentibacter sediminis]|uniref:hypothetical protein n=1 Tax=Confluentibacter sediminis TaxID=2219045 RepID=UPI000DAEFA8C|nr:hypothetical protein [Confluentibacter sediminis]